MLDNKARLNKLATDLYNEMSHGRIDDEWAEEFIENVYNRLQNNQSLTDKQIEKLEQLHEKY